ncbi:MAG: hypothetical protein SH857_13150 [Chitinophagales bacterium]|nr:hypothetical protein [Chitinophagales bacterium]
MKNSALLLAAMFTVASANAQKIKDKDVPASLKTSLQSKYPAATDLKWEKENDNYEAEFEVGETDYSVVFDNTRNILETEVEIKADELPVAAMEYVFKNHSGQKITEAATITDAKGVVTYEAEIKGRSLIFDSNGNFIKEEAEQEDDKK